MSNYKIKSRIWIEKDEKVFLGEGRVRLLKAIEKTGSLSAAARNMGLSYKKAWQLVDSVNRSGEEEVVIKKAGGKNGGGAYLTSYGKELLNCFDSVNEKCWNTLDRQTEKLNRKLL